MVLLRQGVFLPLLYCTHAARLPWGQLCLLPAGVHRWHARVVCVRHVCLWVCGQEEMARGGVVFAVCALQGLGVLCVVLCVLVLWRGLCAVPPRDL